MSVNKSLTLINHNCDRRTSRKTHHWINKLCEYVYLSYMNNNLTTFDNVITVHILVSTK